MGLYKGKLVELPRKGHAIVITDIHGNISDYNKYLELWKKCDKKKFHFIITGDFIHAMGKKNDKSVDILESVKYNFEKYENFHALLGNHEWSVISGVSVYKGGVNQSLNFESLLKERYNEKWKYKFEYFQDFLKKLPIAIRTENKVFISHGGPPKDIKNMGEIVHITDDGYKDNPKLYQILWNREEDFTINDLNEFLDVVGCNAMVVGHTPVDGVKLVSDKQLIVSSSYTLGKKSYLILDLEKEINNARELLKMKKDLHWGTEITNIYSNFTRKKISKRD